MRVIMSKVNVWMDISQSNDADACQIHITFPARRTSCVHIVVMKSRHSDILAA